MSGQRVRVMLGGVIPRSIKGRQLQPGQVLLEGTCAEDVTADVLVLAMREAGLTIVPQQVEAEREPDLQPVGSAVSAGRRGRK